jgi:hypothetical protein
VRSEFLSPDSLFSLGFLSADFGSEQFCVSGFVPGTGERMKPRFFSSPLGVTDAIESACHTYSMIYDKPDEQVRLALESYIHRLVANGERNQDQLTLKSIVFLKKHEGRAGEGRQNRDT